MYVQPVAKLIEELSRLPGIGKKSASRIAFHLINSTTEQIAQLCTAIGNVKTDIVLCDICQNLTDISPCAYCSSMRRDNSIICVAETPQDIMQIEKTHEFNGLYHCLHGVISPLEGITPSSLKIKELLERLADDVVKEVILATNPTVEGEATAMYIAKLVKPLGVLVTRIAHGIPVGGDLEFADHITIGRALLGRREV